MGNQSYLSNIGAKLFMKNIYQIAAVIILAIGVIQNYPEKTLPNDFVIMALLLIIASELRETKDALKSLKERKDND